jgi:hypothetical protein
VWKNIHHTNIKEKKVEMTILILEKSTFQSKEHYQEQKRTFYHKDIKFSIVYNNPKCACFYYHCPATMNKSLRTKKRMVNQS